jgi:hypothetical protein
VVDNPRRFSYQDHETGLGRGSDEAAATEAATVAATVAGSVQAR